MTKQFKNSPITENEPMNYAIKQTSLHKKPREIRIPADFTSYCAFMAVLASLNLPTNLHPVLRNKLAEI